jgi:hypothetical protein
MTLVGIWLGTSMDIQLQVISNLIIQEHLMYLSQRIHLAVLQVASDCRMIEADPI